MGSVFGGLTGSVNEKKNDDEATNKTGSMMSGSIFGGLSEQHTEPNKDSNKNDKTSESTSANGSFHAASNNPFGGLSKPASVSTVHSDHNDGHDTSVGHDSDHDTSVDDKTVGSKTDGGFNPFGGLSGQRDHGSSANTGSGDGVSVAHGDNKNNASSDDGSHDRVIIGSSSGDSFASNPFSGKPFSKSLHVDSSGNSVNGKRAGSSDHDSNDGSSAISRSVDGGKRPHGDSSHDVSAIHGGVSSGGKRDGSGSDHGHGDEPVKRVKNSSPRVVGKTGVGVGNSNAGVDEYGGLVDSSVLGVDGDSGFDPGWSESTGAGEDVDAFIGGSFLDLGEDDDELGDDGLFGPLGSSGVSNDRAGSSVDGERVGDDRAHDDASAGSMKRGGSERDGARADHAVGDDGLLSGEDLVAPPTWKATSSHDAGDDGQQSIAWNKKPLNTGDDGGVTRLERYHHASRAEMQARAEVAGRVNAAGGLDGSVVDPKTGKLVDGVTGRPVLAVGPSSVDASAIAMGVALGSGKAKLEKQLRNKHTVDAAIARRVQVLEWKKGFHVPFGQREIRALDFLVRWSYATTAQIARAAGWREKKESRLVRRIEKWEEMGWVREDTVFAGPRLWYPRSDGAELSLHSWLGGVSPARVNPMSQSHSLGLSSLASWLLCPWDDKPDVLGLGDVAWCELVGEINDGEAIVCGEREYRSAWARLRKSCKGLLPAGYRNAFIGDVVHGGEGRWQEWARDYRDGRAGLEDAPDWVACDPSLMGMDMWLWTVFSNSVWNPKLVFDAAAGDGVDVGSLSVEDRERVLADPRWRQAGYVPVEDRLDIASNRPVLRRDLGDEFALLDHLPDIIIVRKRDAATGGSRSIAVELELSVKSVDDYARSLAGYGSQLGRTLYADVVWVVPSMAVATAIKRGGLRVGMVEGRDYRIVPFATAAKRNSFWSGADIVPARFDKYHRVEPIVDLGSYLWS